MNPGSPVPNEKEESSYIRLPSSKKEALEIARLARKHAPGAKLLLATSFDATREMVLAGELDGYQILHFAAHGVFDDRDSSKSGLVLSLVDREGTEKDGLLNAWDLYHSRLGADTVVLSACWTALGEEIRGEGFVGLAAGFLAAGASHLVVSLWEVEDEATAALMSRFYQHLLRDRMPPGEALFLARQFLRHDTKWQSPSHWAAFVSIGDWTVAGME